MNDFPSRPLSSEVLRPLLIHCLMKGNLNQMGNAPDAVFNAAKEKGMIDTSRQGGHFPVNHLIPLEDEALRILLWEVIIQGIIVPGMNSSNPNLPWISLTDFGRKCLEGGGDILPYDPDGYLGALKDDVPDLDSDVFLYISESLQAFRRGLMLASTVMLGVAAEKAALLMFEAFISAHKSDSKREELRRKISNQRMFKTMYENFRKQFDSLPKRYFPADFVEDIEVQLDGVQSWIRMCRNDAGHPTGRTIRRDQAFANLQLFRPYCKRLHELRNHFANNQIA